MVIGVHEMQVNFGNTHNAGVKHFVSFCLIAGFILAKEVSKLYGQFVSKFEDLVTVRLVTQEEIRGSFIAALNYFII